MNHPTTTAEAIAAIVARYAPDPKILLDRISKADDSLAYTEATLAEAEARLAKLMKPARLAPMEEKI